MELEKNIDEAPADDESTVADEGESEPVTAGVNGAPPLPPDSSEGVLLRNNPVPKSTRLIGELSLLTMFSFFFSS